MQIFTHFYAKNIKNTDHQYSISHQNINYLHHYILYIQINNHHFIKTEKILITSNFQNSKKKYQIFCIFKIFKYNHLQQKLYYDEKKWRLKILEISFNKQY